MECGTRVVIFGIGPHFRERYATLCCELQFNKIIIIGAMVDVQSQKEMVCSFIKDSGLSPEVILFVPDNLVNSEKNENQIECFLTNKLGYLKFSKSIICTEPKSHKVLTLWSIKAGCDVYMDKPISAFYNPSGKGHLMRDLNEIDRAASTHKKKVVVSCERRTHLGYKVVEEELEDLKRSANHGLTAIDIHFCCGNVVTEVEYLSKENHPYKYGYGILLHSGYHYIDLLARLASENWPHRDLSILDISLQATVLSIDKRLGALSGDGIEYNSHFGESDIMLQGSLSGKTGSSIMFSIKLLDSGFSLRNHEDIVNIKKRNTGRLRQENVILHVGHAGSIHVRSLPIRKIDVAHTTDNFEIYILKNNHEKRCPEVTCITSEQLIEQQLHLQQLSLNRVARVGQLKDFVLNQSVISNISSHKNTVYLIDKFYDQLSLTVKS
jgi:hypothetical protein